MSRPRSAARERRPARGAARGQGEIGELAHELPRALALIVFAARTITSSRSLSPRLRALDLDCELDRRERIPISCARRRATATRRPRSPRTRSREPARSTVIALNAAIRSHLVARPRGQPHVQVPVARRCAATASAFTGRETRVANTSAMPIATNSAISAAPPKRRKSDVNVRSRSASDTPTARRPMRAPSLPIKGSAPILNGTSDSASATVESGVSSLSRGAASMAASARPTASGCAGSGRNVDAFVAGRVEHGRPRPERVQRKETRDWQVPPRTTPSTGPSNETGAVARARGRNRGASESPPSGSGRHRARDQRTDASEIPKSPQRGRAHGSLCVTPRASRDRARCALDQAVDQPQVRSAGR